MGRDALIKSHLVIPDLQIKPGVPTDHLSWIGRYILEERPTDIIQLGDLADMESLSSYDVGTIYYEGRRYKQDVEAARHGIKLLDTPVDLFNRHVRRISKKKLYRPDKHILYGNHEHRITRAVEQDPKLDGFMSLEDLGYEEAGWKTHSFLEPVTIDGVCYSHYFYNQLSGRPYGGATIESRMKNIGFSFIQGHQQQYLVGCRTLNNGKRIRGLVCGSCYLHDERYRGPQSNGEWRGIFVLHSVRSGDYDLTEVSLDYLCRRYEGVSLPVFMRDMYPGIFEKSTWMQQLLEE